MDTNPLIPFHDVREARAVAGVRAQTAQVGVLGRRTLAVRARRCRSNSMG